MEVKDLNLEKFKVLCKINAFTEFFKNGFNILLNSVIIILNTVFIFFFKLISVKLYFVYETSAVSYIIPLVAPYLTGTRLFLLQ